MGCNKKIIYCRASSKKSWDGRRMPSIQKEDKIRQVHKDDLFLSEINVDKTEKQDEIENSVVFHGGMVKKIDTLLRDHEKKIILEELISARQPNLFPKDSFVEFRTPLRKKVELSTFIQEKKLGVSIYKKLTMPDEFKTEFLKNRNPSFKFVSDLHSIKDVLFLKNPKNKHVEIINLNSFMPDPNDVHKESILLFNKNPENEKHEKSSFKSKKTDDHNNKNISAATSKQSKEESDKAKIYYLTNKNPDEKKTKELEKKQSYIPIDFKDKMQKLKENEQKELEKQKDTEQKIKEKEQKGKRKEEEKLRKLEEKKAKLEEKQKHKDEKKALAEKLKSEAEEKKLLKKKSSIQKEKKLESTISKKEENKKQKLEIKQVKLAAKQKKKEEKEALIKKLENEKKEKKLRKKTKNSEYDDTKTEDIYKSVEITKEQTFVDDEVIKVLLMTDDLLGNLPEDVIDKFAQSEDFKLYEKVISKFKSK